MERIVKGKRRYRYIGFRVTTQGDARSCTPADLLRAVRQNQRAFKSNNDTNFRLWLVRFDGSSGILKCQHEAKDRIIHLLQSLEYIEGKPVRVTTFSTSGTIRGVSQKK